MEFSEMFNDHSKIPKVLSRSRIKDFAGLEQRYLNVYAYVGDIAAITQTDIKFCPENDPPTLNEILAWLWIIYPQYEDDIFNYATNGLLELMTEERQRRQVWEEKSEINIEGLEKHEAVARLLEEYKQAAEDLRKGDENIDNVATDKALKKMDDLLKKLIEMGEDHRLLQFIDDKSNKWLQWRAATHLLELYEEVALEKLKQLSKTREDGEEVVMLTMRAMAIIDLWRSGKIRYRDG